MAEYQLDELAKDSDDEKNMMKAEKEAERKVLKKRKKAEKSVVSKRAALDDRRAQPLYQPGSSGYQFNRPAYVAARQPSIPSIRPLGPYHVCGEFGHLKRTCPKTLRPLVAP